MSAQADPTAEPTGTTKEHTENGSGHPDIPAEVPVPVHTTTEPTKEAEKDEAAAAKPKGKTNGSAATNTVKKVSSATCLM